MIEKWLPPGSTDVFWTAAAALALVIAVQFGIMAYLASKCFKASKAKPKPWDKPGYEWQVVKTDSEAFIVTLKVNGISRGWSRFRSKTTSSANRKSIHRVKKSLAIEYELIQQETTQKS